jgi:hypothetical protein
MQHTMYRALPRCPPNGAFARPSPQRSVCLFVCLFVCRAGCLSVCLFVSLLRTVFPSRPRRSCWSGPPRSHRATPARAAARICHSRTARPPQPVQPGRMAVGRQLSRRLCCSARHGWDTPRADRAMYATYAERARMHGRAGGLVGSVGYPDAGVRLGATADVME